MFVSVLPPAKEELFLTLRSERQCSLAKNVIIFVGDGMGIFKGQAGEETFLKFERFPKTPTLD